MAIVQCYRCECWLEDDEAFYIKIPEESVEVTICENHLTEEEYDKEFSICQTITTVSR